MDSVDLEQNEQDTVAMEVAYYTLTHSTILGVQVLVDKARFPEARFFQL
jgi:hypothetical protein